MVWKNNDGNKCENDDDNDNDEMMANDAVMKWCNGNV